MTNMTNLIFDYRHNGVDLALTTDPDYSGRALPYQNYQDLEEGEPYDFEMVADAVDMQGNKYRVTWLFTGVKGENDPALDSYDYADIADIELR